MKDRIILPPSSFILPPLFLLCSLWFVQHVAAASFLASLGKITARGFAGGIGQLSCWP